MMECPQFYQDRIKFGLAEKYICLLGTAAISLYDPVDQSCIMRITIPSGFQASSDSQILCVKRNIILVGLSFQGKHTTETLIYDVLSSSWKQAAQIPTARSWFACCASPEGSIYIAGGRTNFNPRRALRDAAVYKVDEDKWELLPEMHQEVGVCTGVSFKGMFYVIGNTCQRFDSNTGLWSTVNMVGQSLLSIYVLFEQLIGFGTNRIQQYDWKGNVWRELDPLPQELVQVSPRVWWGQIYATVWWDRIFLCGKDTDSIDQPTIFYMYKPGAPLSERWISLDRLNLVDMEVVSVSTIEI
ncbi:hypothetical protein SUGI_0701740 [Cryptomeria japonica]|nr:hypothetical protein SUGI_0701740 [Cryptomeria japonica]